MSRAATAKKAPPATRETPLHIRLTEEEKRMFTKAAEQEGLTLSVWARLAMRHAVKSAHKVSR